MAEPDSPKDREEPAALDPEADAGSSRAEAPAQKIRDRNRRLRAEAAEKRRGEREKAKPAAGRNLEAGEIIDDAFARSTHAAATWFKKNFSIVQWVVLGGIVVWVGAEVYSWRKQRTSEQFTEQLNLALRAEQGRIGTGESAPDPVTGLSDTRPVFATAEERLKNSEQAYERALSAAKGDSATAVAKLGLAGILFDQGKHAEAKKAYEEVQRRAGGKNDSTLRARAAEGLGMSLEALGQRDEASKAYRELENLDAPGFGALGLYHQARLAQDGGDTTRAKDLLKKAQEKLEKAEPAPGASSYLRHSIRERLLALDPSAVPAEPATGRQISQEELQKLIKELSKKKAAAPSGSGAPAPAAPAGSSE